MVFHLGQRLVEMIESRDVKVAPENQGMGNRETEFAAPSEYANGVSQQSLGSRGFECAPQAFSDATLEVWTLAIKQVISLKSYWRLLRTPAMRYTLPNKWLEQLGLLSLQQLWCDLDPLRGIPARREPACQVVWGGSPATVALTRLIRCLEGPLEVAVCRDLLSEYVSRYQPRDRSIGMNGRTARECRHDCTLELSNQIRDNLQVDWDGQEFVNRQIRRRFRIGRRYSHKLQSHLLTHVQSIEHSIPISFAMILVINQTLSHFISIN